MGSWSGEVAAVDDKVWRACAGSLVSIPAVHSRAYYFPQGHVEQSSTSLSPSSLPPSIPCRVLRVSLLADPLTDEVLANIQLQPLQPNAFLLEPAKLSDVARADVAGKEGTTDSAGGVVVSFAKVLTPSDANNGGGFSVPRFCADSIFPPLDFGADPPVQNIRVTDVHRVGWDFRHIYRGTPRRHLLTTGWSKFVNSKRLIAGDSVVFIRNKVTEELSVGVRRAYKAPPVGNGAGWGPQQSNYGGGGGGGGGGGFSRNGVGRVAAEVVMEAVERAVRGEVFEVVYYPRPGVPEFVVGAEKVEAALGMYWSSGVRVKMASETEDSSRLQWFQGTVAAVSVPESGVFRGSTWRMLQIAWDEPDLLKHLKKVSPWQVEYVPPTPPIHAAFPPAKKFRSSEDSGMLTDGEGDLPLPRFSAIMGQLSSPYLNYNSFPAGMQGARQNPFFLSSLPNIMKDGTCQMCPDDGVDSMSQKVDAVSTDLNIGSSNSDTPSPDSQTSVQFFSATTTKPCSITRKASTTSFQLFGKIIHMEQPLGNKDEISCTDFDECRAEGTRSTVDNSLMDPFQKLHDGLVAQCQRPPVVEAYVNG